LITEEQVKEYLTSILVAPIVLYSFHVKQHGKNSLLEINLDNIENSFGAVTVADCEKVSREIQSKLEEKYPEENYTIRVSSAGAERELRLPSDLQRFSHLPLKLHFQRNESENHVEIVKILKMEGDTIELEKYSKKIVKNQSTKYLLQVSDIKKGNLYLDI
jgi:ribosome maturation factor RimP